VLWGEVINPRLKGYVIAIQCRNEAAALMKEFIVVSLGAVRQGSDCSGGGRLWKCINQNAVACEADNSISRAGF
jgi:hypothetical protein